MSDVRLVVREEGRDWSGAIHGSFADRAIAALSADPVTLAELEAAMARFARPNPDRPLLANLMPGLNTEPCDAGLVVIDLAARLIVEESSDSAAQHRGGVEYHDGESCTKHVLGYHLADEWLFVGPGENWPTLAEKRRQERAKNPPLDARAVFYGKPLLEYVARETYAAFARREGIAAQKRLEWAEEARERLAKKAGVAPEQVNAAELTESEITPKTSPGDEEYGSPYYDALKEIHAAWMLTPRADLRGACPRDVALAAHDHLSRDEQDRCDQWSRLDRCPPGPDETTHAYQYGGFGTHELVKYYYLVRELLWSSWERLEALVDASNGRHALALSDFLTAEVPRLATVREDWLDTPDPECHGRTPRSIIDRERARLPEGMSGHEAMVDADCPCCQMMADMPGPVFWHLDGCNMDDDFAFNIYKCTRAEWEEEQREWDELSKRSDAEWQERERLGVTDSQAEGSIWSSSFAVGDTPDVPLGIRVFGLGCKLAELVTDLRGARTEPVAPAAQHLIDQLNRDFGNLREMLQSPERSLAEALMDPVIERFVETLASVASARPDLERKCEALASQLRGLLEAPAATPTWESSDDELPF